MTKIRVKLTEWRPLSPSPYHFREMSASVPAFLKASGIAVITGAARGGIGYEIASIALKRHSMKAVLVDQSQAALEATSRALVADGVPEEQFETRTVDVADVRQVQELADHVFQRHGKVDFLVLNAGTSVPSKSFGGDLEAWSSVSLVNSRAVDSQADSRPLV